MLSIVIFFAVENVLILAAALISIVFSSVPKDVVNAINRDEVCELFNFNI
jgi:hypothetical protein